MTRQYLDDPNRNFDSIGDYLDYIENNPPDPSHKLPGAEFASERGDRNFCGTNSFKEAVDLARNGWSTQLPDVADSLDISNSIRGKGPRNQLDLCGEFPVVGEYLSGNPVHMNRRIIKDSLKKPIVKFRLQGSYPWFIKKEAAMNVGKAVAAWVDILEDLGYSVGVEVLFHNYLASVSVPVKRPGQILSIEDCLFFIAHPSALRRLHFRFLEIILDKHNLPMGYGRCEPLKLEKGTITLSDMKYVVHEDPETANNNVEKLIRDQMPELLSDYNE